MQRMGIPRPLFRIEDRLARIIKKQFKALVRTLLQDIKNAAENAHVTLDHAPLTQDSIDDLLDFFDHAAENDEIAEKANLESAINSLEHQWLDNETLLTDKESLKDSIDLALKANQKDYLQRLFSDAGEKMQHVLGAFSIDKQKLFNDNMDALRRIYLDNSIERLGWEQDLIKRSMLKRIIKYVEGDSEKLELDHLAKYAESYGDNLSRLFARDQMQRFNKAVTLSTFGQAGVTKVKWVTSHDVRVRQSHKALDGQIFDLTSLPSEVDDYNCRCGLVPVEWEE